MHIGSVDHLGAELAQQPGLAYARLALDERRERNPLDDSVEEAAHDCDLGLSADHRSARGGE